MPSNAATQTLISYTALDWCLVIIVAASFVSAFRKGIIRVLFSLAGMVTGFVLASWNYLRLAQWLHTWVKTPGVAAMVAFLLIVVGSILAFSILARFVRRTAEAVGLGFFDRLLGGAFGLLRGFFFSVAILMALVAFAPGSSWLGNSVLAPYFLAGTRGLSFVVPRDLQEQIAEGTAHLLQQTPEPIRPGH